MPTASRQCYRVVPVPAEPGALVVDLWGLVDCADTDNPVAGADGEPLVFPFFGAAERWADEHS